jgi:hypothetical protein
MRRGRLLTGIIAVGAVATVAASSALAATPRQIYADLAQHGRLTQHYSAADLQRAARDATVQGYGGVDTQTARPVIQAAVAGVQSTKPVPAQVLGAATTPTGTATLPFTGVQLGVFVALGLVLVGGGLLLHRAGRNDAAG